MRYLLLFYLAFSAFICSAQNPTIPPRLTHQWHKIAALPPGSPILVRELYARRPTPCALVWIDNTSLACDGMDGRNIFLASTLYSVTPDIPSNPHKIPVGPLIVASAGGILGGLIGSNGTAGDTAAGVFIGAGFFGGVAAAITPSSFAPSPRPQWSMQIPRHRVRPPFFR